jgi:hypothetical protein
VAVFQNLDPRSCDGISLPSRSAFTPIFPLSSEPIFPSLFEAIYLHCEGVGVESIFNLLEPWISFSFFFGTHAWPYGTTARLAAVAF